MSSVGAVVGAVVSAKMSKKENKNLYLKGIFYLAESEEERQLF